MATDMTRERTRMVVCPACEGETCIETGEWRTDRDTGAVSMATECCDLCAGTGGIEVELEPITMDDLEDVK